MSIPPIIGDISVLSENAVTGKILIAKMKIVCFIFIG